MEKIGFSLYNQTKKVALNTSKNDIDPRLLKLKIEAELKHGRFKNAENLILSLSKTFPESPEFPLKLGHLMYKLYNYEKAEEYYKIALEKPRLVSASEIYFGLGQTYYALKRYSESCLAFQWVIDHDPCFLMINIVNMKMSLILTNFGEFDSSVNFIIKILKSKPKSKPILAEALCALGFLYETQGNFQLELHYYKIAHEFFKCFRTVSCLAWGYLKTNPQMAEETCKNFLSPHIKQNEWCDIRFLQALAFIKMKEFDRAGNIIEEQLKIFERNEIYLQFLGIVNFYKENFAVAWDCFQKVAEIGKNCEENLHNLNATYQKLRIETNNSHFEGNLGKDQLEIVFPRIFIFDFPTNVHKIISQNYNNLPES